jgi:hypothetical protein
MGVCVVAGLAVEALVDGAEVHGVTHELRVIGDIQHNRVDRILEHFNILIAKNVLQELEAHLVPLCVLGVRVLGPLGMLGVSTLEFLELFLC